MTTESIKLKSHTLSANLRKVFSLMGRTEKMALLILSIIVFIDLFYFVHGFYVNQTNSVPTFGGRYREGILGQPRLINPLIGSGGADLSLIRLVYSGLYKYDTNGNIIPDLAESLPQISDDQKQYTIALRQDALWHNGQKVTAEDVVFTVHLLQNPDFNSPLRGSWLNTTVEKNGDYTVIFGNKDISAPFIHNLTLPILPAQVWSTVSASNFLLSPLNLEAVGSGPYTIREIKKLPSGKIQSIRLESFSNYYLGKPYIDTVTTAFYDSYEELVSALQGKAIDGFGYTSLDTTLTLNKERNNIALYNIPLSQYQAAFFNIKNPVLSDKNVRHALQAVTNISKIRQEIFADSGVAVAGPILPQQLRITEDYTNNSPDIAIAASLLDQAGWLKNPQTNIRTKNNAPLELTITTNDFPLNSKTAELLATQWKTLDITVNLNIISTKDLTDTILPARNYDVLVFAIKLSADPDPFIFWHSSQAKDPGLNITQFNNVEADKIISDARSSTDFSARLDKYKRFQEVIAAEMPAIFLNQTTFVYAVSKDVQGLDIHALHDPSFRFFSLASWYTEERRVWKD